MKFRLSSEHFHSNYSQLQLCIIKFRVIKISSFFPIFFFIILPAFIC